MRREIKDVHVSRARTEKSRDYVRRVDFRCLNVTRITWNKRGSLDGSSRKSEEKRKKQQDGQREEKDREERGRQREPS